MLTELHDDLSKIVWVSRASEKSSVAHLPLVFWPAPEAVLLNVRHTLHKEANRKQDNSRNISARSKPRLLELGDTRRVQDYYW